VFDLQLELLEHDRFGVFVVEIRQKDQTVAHAIVQRDRIAVLH
jgi:hypothetical protein